MSRTDTFMFAGEVDEMQRLTPSSHSPIPCTDRTNPEDNMQYTSDPDHHPMRRTPGSIATAINKAKADGDWHAAGRIFGGHLFDMWPEGRAIDELYEPVAELTSYPPLTTDGEDRTPLSNRVAALCYFYARAPAVVAAVPWCNLDAFVDGACERFFGDGVPAGCERHALAAQ